jgi:hypothetical protein
MHYIQAHIHECPECGSTYDCFDGQCMNIEELICSSCEYEMKFPRFISVEKRDAVQNNEDKSW